MTAAGPASAAEKAPAPPPHTWSWSGVYFGGHGGYGWGRDPFTNNIFSGQAPPLTDISSKGAFGGLQAGANWQAGSWVGGLEIDLSLTSIKGSTSTTTGPLPFGGGATITHSATQTDKFDTLGSARARLGFLPVPNVLIFGTAGPAWTRFVQTVTIDSQDLIPGSGQFVQTFVSETPSWELGLMAGGGVETRLGDSNWLGRVEYLHYDFGNSGGLMTGNLTLDVVRGGLSYKLGAGFPGAAGAASAKAMPIKALPLKAPPGAPWTWSGFYIGGHAGYGWGHDPFFIDSRGLTEDVILSDGIGSNGFVGGFHAGANWQAGAWLGGLEVDLSGTDIRGSTSGTVPITVPGIAGTDTVTMSDKFDLLGSARVRLGRLFWPDVLLYGTGGLAWTRMRQTTDFDEIVTAGGTTFTSSSTVLNWELGWTAGVGLEARLWNSNWLGRIEYLHYDFGNQGSNFDPTGVTFSSRHLTTDVVRAGLSYKFDWSNPSAAPARMAMPVKARPVVVAAADWSGFYVGGHVGHGWARDPVSNSVSGPSILVAELFTSIAATGVVGGFQTGANWQTGAFVAGLEFDMSATGIKGSSNAVPAANPFVIETHTDKFDSLGTARVRAGFLAWPNLLLYGTGGLAWARIERSFLNFPSAGAAPSGGATPEWKFGWVAGGGGEVRLADTDWFLRAEYLHYDFGDSGSFLETINSTLPPDAGISNFISVTGHTTVDVVRTGLSYKLD